MADAAGLFSRLGEEDSRLRSVANGSELPGQGCSHWLGDSLNNDAAYLHEMTTAFNYWRTKGRSAMTRRPYNLSVLHPRQRFAPENVEPESASAIT